MGIKGLRYHILLQSKYLMCSSLVECKNIISVVERKESDSDIRVNNLLDTKRKNWSMCFIY